MKHFCFEEVRPLWKNKYNFLHKMIRITVRLRCNANLRLKLIYYALLSYFIQLPLCIQVAWSEIEPSVVNGVVDA